MLGKTSKVFIATAIAGSLLWNPLASSAATPKPTDIGKISVASQQAINALYEKGMMSGYEDGTFKPKNGITRAEFAGMLTRVMKLSDGTKGQKFADSDTNKWHYSVLNTAYKHGLLTGTGVDKKGNPIMSPNKKITRLEMMVILVRAHEKNFGKIDLSKEDSEYILEHFVDQKEVPKWARNVVGKAVFEGITSGVSKTRLGSKESGTREQSAIFAYRAYELLEELKVHEEKTKEVHDFLTAAHTTFTLYRDFGNSDKLLEYADWMDSNEGFAQVVEKFAAESLATDTLAINQVGARYQTKVDEINAILGSQSKIFEKYGYGGELDFQTLAEPIYRMTKDATVQQLSVTLKSNLMKNEDFQKTYQEKLNSLKTVAAKKELEDVMNMYISLMVVGELVNFYYDNDDLESLSLQGIVNAL